MPVWTFTRRGMQPKITMKFNDKGTKDFGDLTTAHVNERLAIVLDNEVLSAPNIREPILTGDAEITGDFKFEEASLLALALRTGALPVPMTIEEERTIGPLLGKDSIEAGITRYDFRRYFDRAVYDCLLFNRGPYCLRGPGY